MRNNFLYLVLILLCSGISLSAQNEDQTENNLYKNIIGGSLSLGTQNNSNSPFLVFPSGYPTINTTSSSPNESTYKSYNFSTYYGRQLSHNFVAGIIGQYNYAKNEVVGLPVFIPVEPFPINTTVGMTTLSSNTSKGYDVWLFARYTFNPASKLQFFLQPMIGARYAEGESFYLSSVSNGTGNDSSTNSSSKRTLIDFRLNPGICYTIGKRWNLLARFGTLAYSFGSNEVSSRSFDGRSGNLITSTYEKDVNEAYLNLRLSNIYLGAEFKF